MCMMFTTQMVLMESRRYVLIFSACRVLLSRVLMLAFLGFRRLIVGQSRVDTSLQFWTWLV